MSSKTDETKTLQYERLDETGFEDDKKPLIGKSICTGLKSFFVDIANQFDAVYNKLEAIAKCNCLFAILSIISIGQLAIFVLGVINLRYCTVSYGLPQWLMAQAAFTIIWHFVINFLRNRSKFTVSSARLLCNCVLTLAVVVFAIAHFVVMFAGVVQTYAIFNDELSQGFGINPSPDYYNYYNYGRQTCDGFTYWTAFAVSNVFLVGLAIFFLIFAGRAMCKCANKTETQINGV